MDKKTQVIPLVCSIVGCVADAIAILVGLKSWNVAVLIFISTFILLVGTINFLYDAYRNRCNFINFVEYLFEQNFNLLPKICLALDKSKETNNLHVRELQIKYTYNMQKIDLESLNKDTPIEYTDTIEYKLQVENVNLPKEYVFYSGNMYAKNSDLELEQKHGVQACYDKVPNPRYMAETRSDSLVQRYCWQLKEENITRRGAPTIEFRLNCIEKTRANSRDTIIIYPQQLAKRVEKIVLNIDFMCNKNILKKIELYKIRMDGKGFKNIPISTLAIKNNAASVEIQVDSAKYEAYYAKVYWELV